MTRIRREWHALRPDDAERLQNAAEIAELLRSSGDLPVFVCGDFYVFPDSRLHRKLKSSFTDAWESSGGEGSGATYPSPEPRSRIDYVFHASRERLTATQARIVRSEASDHLPLVVTFQLR